MSDLSLTQEEDFSIPGLVISYSAERVLCSGQPTGYMDT